MPNAFLRRVIARRELEQELAIVDTPPQAMLRHCRGCNKLLTEGTELIVCTNCGGMSESNRIRAREAAEQNERRRREHALRLAGFQITTAHPPPQGVTVSDDERKKCTSCGKKLRPQNQTGVCWSCRTAGEKPVEGLGGGFIRG